MKIKEKRKYFCFFQSFYFKKYKKYMLSLVEKNSFLVIVLFMCF